MSFKCFKVVFAVNDDEALNEIEGSENQKCSGLRENSDSRKYFLKVAIDVVNSLTDDQGKCRPENKLNCPSLVRLFSPSKSFPIP